MSESDPLHDYVANTELLAEFTRKREEVSQRSEELRARGHSADTLIASIDSHCLLLRHLVSQQERLIDDVLNATANSADSSRALFMAVADMVKMVQRLTPEEWSLVPQDTRTNWNSLLRQFDSMRSEWIKTLPPEDLSKLEE